MRGKRNSGKTKIRDTKFGDTKIRDAVRNSGDTIPIQENWVMSPNFVCPRISGSPNFVTIRNQEIPVMVRNFFLPEFQERGKLI